MTGRQIGEKQQKTTRGLFRILAAYETCKITVKTLF